MGPSPARPEAESLHFFKAAAGEADKPTSSVISAGDTAAAAAAAEPSPSGAFFDDDDDDDDENDDDDAHEGGAASVDPVVVLDEVGSLTMPDTDALELFRVAALAEAEENEE